MRKTTLDIKKIHYLAHEILEEWIYLMVKVPHPPFFLYFTGVRETFFVII